MHMKIGIDPTGGTDPWSKDIVWSPEKDAYDKFERYEVQAVARSNKVTVFTHSRPENPMEHNDVYLDDAELAVVRRRIYRAGHRQSAAGHGGGGKQARHCQWRTHFAHRQAGRYVVCALRCNMACPSIRSWR